jgi:hypothetical protein
MPEQTVIARVEKLEKKMELLEGLPDRVTAMELQIVQLRGEVREHFSAVRQEFRDELRTVEHSLRAEIQAGDEETRRYIRVLHEEVLSRIATIHDGGRNRRSKM